MKTIKLEIELTYDDEMMHSGDADIEARTWFHETVLMGSELILHSNDIGNHVGSVTVKRILLPQGSSSQQNSSRTNQI